MENKNSQEKEEKVYNIKNLLDVPSGLFARTVQVNLKSDALRNDELCCISFGCAPHVNLCRTSENRLELVDFR